jgi:hypothetical protein
MLPPSSPYYISQYGCHWQRASPSTAPALAVCEVRVDGRGSSLPRGDGMTRRLTRSGAALQWRRARAPDDLRYRGSSRPGSGPNSAGAEVWNLECPLENKVPRASAGISARQALSFPRFRFTNRPGPGGQGQPQESRGSLPGTRTRRTAGRAPRPPGSEPNLSPGPAGGGASQPGLGIMMGHSPPRRPPSGLATSPRWHLNLGCLRLWPLVQQQHTEAAVGSFNRRGAHVSVACEIPS